jgi:phosphate/sulfate permease
MSALFLVLGALAVAAANGANDNFKGVATLFGSRTASYRTSLAWATLTTFAGSLAAMFLGSRLAAAFTGHGLLPSRVVAETTLLTAVAVGAALTVGVAARAGIPISTTHAILGALLGAGAIATNGQLLWNDPSSRHRWLRGAASEFSISFRSQRRRIWQGASTTNHSAIRGLLRLPGAEPHDRAPSGESAV